MNSPYDVSALACVHDMVLLWESRARVGRSRLVTMSARSTIKPTNPIKGFYRPELDALRFGCFLLVFFHHAFSRSEEGWKTAAVDAAGFGVPVFFLLSSFLITELLLRERQGSGRVHAGAFYMRRILRIWPLYFGFLGFCWVMGGFGLLHAVPTAMGLSFLVMAGNWYFVAMGTSLSPAGILWSVSLEEQFYLVWPWMMRLGRVRVLAFANVSMVAVSYAAIWTLAAMGQGPDMAIWGNTLVQMQFFAVGSLLAMGLRVWEPRTTAWGRLGLVAGCAAAWMAAAGFDRVKRFDLTISPVHACVGYALMVVGAVCLFGAVCGLKMSCIGAGRALVYLGRISYGLYVFHILMINAGGRLLKAVGLPARQGSPAMVMLPLAMTIVAAVVSYEFFEKPFLRLKSQWTFVRSRDDGGRVKVGMAETLGASMAADRLATAKVDTL